MAKPKAKKKAAGAAEVLFKAIGKPRNINTVDVAAKPCVKKWLARPDAERADIVAELASALDAMRALPDWEDIRPCAWNFKYEFTQMVSLGKAIDRLIRGKLPLTEATLTKLAHVVVHRSDFSVKHLTTQLEHYGKTQVVGGALRAAMVAINERYSWSDYEAMRARLAWLISPAQADRLAKGKAA
ncbi:MAG: hypothetical protein M4D80_08260 [Myxococcota bacterium]|nr:hypothetical protein [Myxococcota bacterium]